MYLEPLVSPEKWLGGNRPTLSSVRPLETRRPPARPTLATRRHTETARPLLRRALRALSTEQRKQHQWNRTAEALKKATSGDWSEMSLLSASSLDEGNGNQV